MRQLEVTDLKTNNQPKKPLKPLEKPTHFKKVKQK